MPIKMQYLIHMAKALGVWDYWWGEYMRTLTPVCVWCDGVRVCMPWCVVDGAQVHTTMEDDHEDYTYLMCAASGVC